MNSSPQDPTNNLSPIEDDFDFSPPNTLAPDKAVIRRHLELMKDAAGPEYDDGLIEIAHDDPARGDFGPSHARLFGLDELDLATEFAVEKNAACCNMWVGVALKTPDTRREGRTKAETNFYVAPMVAYDADHDVEAVRLRVAQVGEPAESVTTGTEPETRVQGWLRLTEPCTDYADFKTAFKALSDHVGGDEDARGDLMRLPGTVSFPQPKKQAKGYQTELTTAVFHPAATPVSIERLTVLAPLADRPRKERARKANAPRGWTLPGPPPKPGSITRAFLVAELKDALRWIPADKPEYIPDGPGDSSGGGRPLWVDMGQGLSWFGEDGLHLWLEWSAASTRYDEAKALREWSSFHPDHITWLSVFAEAHERGWPNPRGSNDDEPEDDCGPERRAYPSAKSADAALPTRAASPLPLFPPIPAGEPYPVDALGLVLGQAAKAIAAKVEVPHAMSGQSVLAAAALATQAHADVQLPGILRPRPLSLFSVTIAESGDRKSATDDEALRPVVQHEANLRDDYALDMERWRREQALWAADRAKIISRKSTLDSDARSRALDALGAEPPRPLHPLLTSSEPTAEGLVKHMPLFPASLGVFSTEGGQFINGHGMSDEAKLRTAGAYSKFWDGGIVNRIRAGEEGVPILPGRRISMHLMVQPEAAGRFLADPVLRDQGILSRVLTAHPESLAGKRFGSEIARDEAEAINSYHERLLTILQTPWPLADGARNELAPPVVELSREAVGLHRGFNHRIEREIGPGGDLTPVKGFAAKLGEQVCRIAGVQALVTDLRVHTIKAEVLASAITLGEWYLGEALRLAAAGRTSHQLLTAQMLLDWLRGRGEAEVRFSDILQYGPRPLRTKAAAEPPVRVLLDHGWLSEVSNRPRTFRLWGQDPN